MHYCTDKDDYYDDQNIYVNDVSVEKTVQQWIYYYLIQSLLRESLRFILRYRATWQDVAQEMEGN